MDKRISVVDGTGERELVITRVFDAPRSLVFRLWTASEHLARWWGPKDYTVVSWRMDVRPGGTWFRRMRAPDGTEERRRGVYREIVEPDRLVFTYMSVDAEGNPGHETLVTVTFADLGGKTRLTLHQAEFESIAARGSHLGGWSGCLERFAGYLGAALT